jgi:hypothetical protein
MFSRLCWCYHNKCSEGFFKNLACAIPSHGRGREGFSENAKWTKPLPATSQAAAPFPTEGVLAAIFSFRTSTKAVWQQTKLSF